MDQKQSGGPAQVPGMQGAGQAPALREIGPGHKWGSHLYEVLRGGQVVAKLSASPEDAAAMLAGLSARK